MHPQENTLGITMSDESQRQQYLSHFSGASTAQGRQVEALKQALDIRKFEIELYWKRAAYFWTFIAVAFAGYFALQKDGTAPDFDSTYVVGCLGLVFSLAWYFVNRGSSAWQRSWERQVDLLEDEVMGPLYKSTLDRYTYRLWHIAGPYPFSPSKINHILGLLVTLVWLFLVIRTLVVSDWYSGHHLFTTLIISALTLFSITLLIFRGRTSKSDAPASIEHRRRVFVEERPE